MTFSYADVMKRPQPAAKVKDPPILVQPQPKPDTIPSSKNLPTRQNQPQQRQRQQQKPDQQKQQRPQQQPQKNNVPSQSVWGKQRHTEPRGKNNAFTEPRTQPQSAKIPNENSTGTNSVKQEPMRILLKNDPSPWKTVASANATVPVQPREIPVKKESQVKIETKTKGPMPQGAKKIDQQSVSAKKKNKPQLKSVSLGDMISAKPNQPLTKRGQQQKQQQPQQQQQTKKQSTQSIDLTRDFPSLGSSEGKSNKSKPIIAKPTWGKGTTSSKVPTGTSPTKQNLQTKKPTGIQGKTPPSQKSQNVKSENSTAQSAAMFFQPKMDVPREGDEHQLLRLLQDRNVYQKKGRQRLNPRKKKFSALKKKILQERLQKWRELNPQDNKEDSPTLSRISSSVCIYNYVHAEELEDDDEYNEIVANIQDFASKVGSVKDVFIPRIDRDENYPAFVRFESSKDAAAALACWNGLVIGGEGLRVISVEESVNSTELDWKESVLLAESTTVIGEPAGTESTDGLNTVVELSGFLTDDDYDDDDCMSESLADLRAVATKCGRLQKLEPSETKDGTVLLTYEASPDFAEDILQRLQNVTIGGKQLAAKILPQTTTISEDGQHVVVLDNILTEDDLEDDDCMQETLADIRELVGRHGKLLNIQVVDKSVNVTYEGSLSVAQLCANALNGMTLGGVTVTARVVVPPTTKGEENIVFLHNILTDDDLEDEDCLEESLNDIRTLASKHGIVKDLKVEKEEGKVFVQIVYDDGETDAVKSAVVEFDGMVVGGLIVAATSHVLSKQRSPADANEVENDTAKRKPDAGDETTTKKARTDEVKPLYSGDKLIPERFAEAKRVPKIPNAPGPREYAKQTNDERVKPLLTEMLGELMRLQKRAIEENNTKAKRRLVMGLREVARGIRSHKVKMVVMANNLDEYGAIDAKLQEIIDLAHNEDVPLFFEFTKRNLGKALGKSIKIAVVGIQNADGAHQPFKKLVSLASNF